VFLFRLRALTAVCESIFPFEAMKVRIFSRSMLELFAFRVHFSTDSFSKVVSAQNLSKPDWSLIPPSVILSKADWSFTPPSVILSKADWSLIPPSVMCFLVETTFSACQFNAVWLDERWYIYWNSFETAFLLGNIFLREK
jgi:hypothetical protein